MLLILSSCPSNKHKSTSLCSTTLLTLIKALYTWFNLGLRGPLDSPSDPPPCLPYPLQLPILWSIYLGHLSGPKWHSGMSWTLRSKPPASSPSWKQSVVPSQSRSLFSSLASFTPRWVILPYTIPQWLRTIIIPDLDIIAIRTQYQGCYYLVWTTSIHAPNSSLWLPVLFSQVPYLCVSHK